MFYPERLFINIFNSKEITPDRLLLFAKDCLARMIKGNTGNIFDAQIALITPYITTLEGEVSGVDTTLNLQVGQTDEVDIITHNFSTTMSGLVGVIARSLGGKNSIGYKEFYPHKLFDYGKPTRTSMPTLTMRVNKAATKYAALLGATVTAELQAFEAEYTAARALQSGSIVDLSDHRTDRTKSVVDIELTLMKVIYKVGTLFVPDVVKCTGFFNFNLLFTVTHRKHVLYNNSLLAEEKVVVINRSFTDNVTMALRNKGTNADLEIWTATTADGLPSVLMLTIAPGKAAIVVPSSIGDVDNTFLIVKNASAVNPATYEIEIIG